MARMLGEPVDPELIESIKREEQLTEAFFGVKKETPVEIEPEPVIMKSNPITEFVSAPLPPQEEKPAETGVQHLNVPDPEEKSKVHQAAEYLDKIQKLPASKFKDAELEVLRKTVAELLNRVNTLSWGGGGTGAVRINDQDDFDKTSYAEGRYLRWTNGMFRLDEINPHDVVYNTTEINMPYYELDANDFYLGVTYAGPTIELPATTSSGRMIIIKDETGNCSNNPITVTGTVDNDAGGFILKIDNGGIQLLFRNGWRIV